MPLFGQILAALYQEDIVDEDDIRSWHILPASKGEGRKPGPETESFKKCWLIGSHMIKQFDEQDSDEGSEESESEEEKEVSMLRRAESEGESGEENGDHVNIANESEEESEME